MTAGVGSGLRVGWAATAEAMAIALVELAAAGAYAAISHRASPARTIASAVIALGLGLLVVLLKVLVH